jgi:hypothetical protein
LSSTSSSIISALAGTGTAGPPALPLAFFRFGCAAARAGCGDACSGGSSSRRATAAAISSAA